MAAVAAGYIRLNYTPSGGSLTYVDLKILSIKGQDDPDWFELFPDIVNTALDGSKESQFTSFRRKVRVDCGVVSSRSDRIAILDWLLDNSRTIDYGVAGTGAGAETTLPFVPQQTEYETNWREDCSLMREFVLELDESVVRTTFPTA
jgi:hypothetical protein